MGRMGRFGMLVVASCSMPVLADDPKDPTMTPQAIARDRAVIQQLNRRQAEYVRQRDAGYARGWQDYEAARGQASSEDEDEADDYTAMRRDYAAQRREYEQAVRDWKADVAACRAGYYDRCDNR